MPGRKTRAKASLAAQSSDTISVMSSPCPTRGVWIGRLALSWWTKLRLGLVGMQSDHSPPLDSTVTCCCCRGQTLFSVVRFGTRLKRRPCAARLRRRLATQSHGSRPRKPALVDDTSIFYQTPRYPCLPLSHCQLRRR